MAAVVVFSCISLQISDKVCMFFVNIFLKSMRKVTTLTKLCRLSPVGHVPSMGGPNLWVG